MVVRLYHRRRKSCPSKLAHKRCRNPCAEQNVGLPVMLLCSSTKIFASENFIELFTYRSDNATRPVFCALLLKMIDYIDVDRFAVDIEDNLVERFKNNILPHKSIVRVLAIMPVDGELLQVGDTAKELTGKIGTESEYFSAYFRFNIVRVSLKPLSIPDKRNRRITDVMERRIGLGT